MCDSRPRLCGRAQPGVCWAKLSPALATARWQCCVTPITFSGDAGHRAIGVHNPSCNCLECRQNQHADGRRLIADSCFPEVLHDGCGTHCSRRPCVGCRTLRLSRRPRSTRILRLPRKTFNHLPRNAQTGICRRLRRRSRRWGISLRAHASSQRLFPLAPASGLRPGMPAADRD